MNKEPDKPTEVTAALLARTQIQKMVRKSESGNKYFTYDQMLSKYISWTEFAEDLVFNKITTEEANFVQIPTGNEMVAYASEEEKDTYLGLAYLIKCWEVYDISMKLGDVPYSEAGQALEGLLRPKYDPRKK
ncbi:MAG: SusD/RagB family nutrient-binding outer membrane lipoprotein [Tannerellaceae bacterium]|nr:SusD/RagB family nutrient-binding outer membrane lipoprotein [Tannerellaceae bacterium]